MAVTAYEAGAVHDIGPAVENRLEQPWIIGWVVFQISILYEDHIASRMMEPCAKRRALTAILLVKDDSYARKRSEILQDRACPISREIVNDDDLDSSKGR